MSEKCCIFAVENKKTIMFNNKKTIKIMKTNFFEDEFEDMQENYVNADEQRYLVTLDNGVSYTWNNTELENYKKTYDNSKIKEIIEI